MPHDAFGGSGTRVSNVAYAPAPLGNGPGLHDEGNRDQAGDSRDADEHQGNNCQAENGPKIWPLNEVTMHAGGDDEPAPDEKEP